MPLYGAVEAGGTKFVCAVGTGPNDLRAEVRFATTQPDETLAKTVAFFRDYMAKNKTPIDSIGIGSFGPVELNQNAPHYGKITATPKPGWSYADVANRVQSETGVPVIFDTDVNAAALGEGRWGAAQGLSDFIYITIGTGIGGGVIVGAKPLHGLVHPEVGHMRLPHNFEEDPFPGHCPFHEDCFEGLAAGPALNARYGVKAETLSPSHPAWQLEAKYIALALNNLICSISPQKVILGGGVMQQAHLFPLIRHKVLEFLQGYVNSPAILDHIETYIVPPALGNRAGILGSIALAQQSR